jgi:hypothetical protein
VTSVAPFTATIVNGMTGRHRYALLLFGGRPVTGLAHLKLHALRLRLCDRQHLALVCQGMRCHAPLVFQTGLPSSGCQRTCKDSRRVGSLHTCMQGEGERFCT